MAIELYDTALHKKVTISSFGSETIYFTNTGDYFAKTKATIKGKSPVYQKGKPFRVVNDATGYSVMTLTFSIRESITPEVTGGRKISKEEFDKD